MAQLTACLLTVRDVSWSNPSVLPLLHACRECHRCSIIYRPPRNKWDAPENNGPHSLNLRARGWGLLMADTPYCRKSWLYTLIEEYPILKSYCKRFHKMSMNIFFQPFFGHEILTEVQNCLTDNNYNTINKWVSTSYTSSRVHSSQWQVFCQSTCLLEDHRG